MIMQKKIINIFNTCIVYESIIKYFLGDETQGRANISIFGNKFFET